MMYKRNESGLVTCVCCDVSLAHCFVSNFEQVVSDVIRTVYLKAKKTSKTLGQETRQQFYALLALFWSEKNTTSDNSLWDNETTCL